MDIYDDECIQADGKKGTMPADFLEHDRELGEIQRENFRKAVKAGAKLAFGTDAGVCAYGNLSAAVRVYGEVRHDANADDPICDLSRGGPDRTQQPVRIDQAGEVCRCSCGFG